jgi:hypothetical protein
MTPAHQIAHDGPVEQRDGGRSRWSIASEDSFLSIASKNSVLSIASVGSALSIGSIGSFGSLLAIGSFCSAGSLLSAVSIWSVLSWRAKKGLVSPAPTSERIRRRGELPDPRTSR